MALSENIRAGHISKKDVAACGQQDGWFAPLVLAAGVFSAIFPLETRPNKADKRFCVFQAARLDT